MKPPRSAPSRIVAMPKVDGTGRNSPSGETGAAPKPSPSTAPQTAAPIRTASALRYSCSAYFSIRAGSNCGWLTPTASARRATDLRDLLPDVLERPEPQLGVVEERAVVDAPHVLVAMRLDERL